MEKIKEFSNENDLRPWSNYINEEEKNVLEPFPTKYFCQKDKNQENHTDK
jgi:hypothetical protein